MKHYPAQNTACGSRSGNRIQVPASNAESRRSPGQIGRGILGMAAAAWVFSIACSQETPEQAMAAAEAAAQAAADSTSLNLAAERFGDFLERYPRHESAPKALRMLAMITQQEGDMRGAIGHYERLLEKYGSSEYADDAQFMIGFISEEYLDDYPRAPRVLSPGYRPLSRFGTCRQRPAAVAQRWQGARRMGQVPGRGQLPVRPTPVPPVTQR